LMAVFDLMRRQHVCNVTPCTALVAAAFESCGFLFKIEISLSLSDFKIHKILVFNLSP